MLKKSPFLDMVYDIADNFISEFPQYSPYRTSICNGLLDIFDFCFDKMNGEIENEDLQKATNQILMDNNRNQEKIADRVYSYKYIDLDRINMNYGIEDIYIDMAVCSDCDSDSKESIVDAFLRNYVQERNAGKCG